MTKKTKTPIVQKSKSRQYFACGLRPNRECNYLVYVTYDVSRAPRVIQENPTFKGRRLWHTYGVSDNPELQKMTAEQVCGLIQFLTMGDREDLLTLKIEIETVK